MVKKICILIATYKRKLSLIKLLRSLVNLHIPSDANIQILITANDSQNYSEILKLFKNKIKIKIIRERKKGISYARNKYLKEIRLKNYDYIAFFDDDVEVDKKWLVEMLKFLKKTKVDIIGGPQLTKSHSLFSHLLIRQEKHEARIKWVSTNNCFVKKIVLKNNLKFSDKLNLIGGEDQLFFLLQKQKGFQISWNQKAKVFEEKKNYRDNLSWFIKRNFRYGTSSYIIYKNAYGNVTGIFYLFAKIVLDLIKSIFYLLLSIGLSKKNFYNFLMHLSRFAGSIFGLLGFQYKEYA